MSRRGAQVGRRWKRPALVASTAITSGAWIEHPGWGVCRVAEVDREHDKARIVFRAGREITVSYSWATKNCRPATAQDSALYASPDKHGRRLSLPHKGIGLHGKQRKMQSPPQDEPVAAISRVPRLEKVIHRGGLCSSCFRVHTPLYVLAGCSPVCRFCRPESGSQDALDHAELCGAFESNRRRH